MRRKTTDKLSKQERRILQNFGEAVRRFREKRNFTVYDVSGEDMPIRSRQHWQIIENGKKNVSLLTVYKIAWTLGVDPVELITKSR